MKKVIITGASGYIGRNLICEISEDIEIYALVHKEDIRSEELRKINRVTVISCPMENISQLISLIPDRTIDCCIHLAWAGNSGKDRADYAMQLGNVKYTLDLIQILSQMNVRRFVGIGTLAQKDVLNYHTRDGSLPNDVSHYATAKIAAHYMSKAECTKLGIEHIWCYLSNTYGVENTTNNFVNMASKKMLAGEHAAFTSGEQIYDFVYITDTVKAIYAVTLFGKLNSSYYLGSGTPRPLKDYIIQIRNAIDPGIEIYLGEIPFYGIALPEELFRVDKLFRDTGFKAKVSFEEGIKKTIDWLKKQQK